MRLAPHLAAWCAPLLLGAVAAQAGSGPDWTALPPADVVILGEVHDNPRHHENQARAVEVIAPAALVFEMITPEQASRITPALRADPEALAAALEWDDSGWPDFNAYYPIFATAPQAAIFGGGLPREAVRRAVSEGARAVFGEGAARFGLDRPLPPDEQQAREAMQAAVHCDALPEEMLPGMVEAQRLRDAALASAVIDAVEESGTPVVLITGTGHARLDWGVPVYLAAAAPDLSVYSVGQLESGSDAPDDSAFDLLVLTEPEPREDPCAAFQ